MKARYLALIAWIVVFLVATEVALETRAHRNGWNTLIYGPVVRVPASGAPSDGALSAVMFGPTDAFPFRSEIVPAAAEPGVERVWIASASHAEDIHLAADVIFPHRLAQLRTDGGRPTEVLNASRAGLSIAANSLMIRDEARSWHPDYAVLYQASIDIGRLAGATEDEVDPAAPETGVSTGLGGSDWLDRTFESTTTYELLAGTLRARLGTQRVLMDRLSAETIDRYEMLVGEFVSTARAAGIRPVLATFATSHTEADLGSIPDHIVLGVFQFNDQLSMAGWLDAIARANGAVERVAAREGVVVVPIANALTGRPEYFRDLVHFTPSGHARVAETIRATLDQFDTETIRTNSDEFDAKSTGGAAR